MNWLPHSCRIGALLCAWIAAAPAAEQFQKVTKDSSVQPTPPANAPPVQFIGNASYTPAQLQQPLAESLKEIKDGGLTKPRADDAAYFLSVYYRKQGFPEVDVQWDIRGGQLVLTIKEGVRAYLGKITYEGNRTQASTLLDQYMIGETDERLKKQPQGFPFVEADVQTGVARVRGYYETEGHLDAVINDAVITYSGDRTHADVLVKISEGPRYTFDRQQVVFAGTPVFERSVLLTALGEPLENPYTTQRANTMQHNLEYYFKLHGYYAAEVSVLGDPKKSKPGPKNVRLVPVTFTIKSGPLYKFDGVTVKGLDRLHPSFIQNRFRSLSGLTYTPTALDDKYRELLRTGLFSNLRVVTTPLPTDEVRVDLAAEESKAKQIGFSGGFSTYEGFLLGVRLADLDFMGLGRPLSLDLDYTSRSIRAELLYVDPWLFESDNSLRSRLFVQSRDEIGYSKQEVGARFDLTRKVADHIELGAFFSLRDVTITQSSIKPQFLGPTSYQIATLGFTQSFDYRNNKVNPSEGWIISMAEDADALESGLAFGRGTARATYFIPIEKRYLLALGARGGLIYPVSEVPIDERYFNGGSTTVRSFRERRLGPESGGNPIGGEEFTVFNAELEIPIRGALYGALFFDAGNLISQFKDAGLNDMRYGVGFGIRYQLPIGPVRLDIGFNPDPRENEEWGAVNFSFGFAF